jgi:hypothetical protein
LAVVVDDGRSVDDPLLFLLLFKKAKKLSASSTRTQLFAGRYVVGRSAAAFIEGGPLQASRPRKLGAAVVEQQQQQPRSSSCCTTVPFNKLARASLPNVLLLN